MYNEIPKNFLPGTSMRIIVEVIIIEMHKDLEQQISELV